MTECLKERAGLPEMLAEFRKNPVSYQKVPSARHLIVYFQCRALDAGSPEPCRDLSGIGAMSGRDGPRQPLEHLCVEAYQEARIAEAAVRGDPRAGVLCRSLPPQPEFVDMDSACALLQRSAANPSALRAGLPAVLRSPGDRDQARRAEVALRRTLGDGWACEQMDPHSPSHTICLEYAAYRRALSRGPEACGDKGLCRRLLGERAPGCDAILPRLQEIYCRLWVARRLSSRAPSDPAVEGAGRKP